jgi:hypothetical protein
MRAGGLTKSSPHYRALVYFAETTRYSTPEVGERLIFAIGVTVVTL